MSYLELIQENCKRFKSILSPDQKTEEGNPAETVVKIWRHKAEGAKLQLQLDIYPGSQFALDDITLEDCSKDPSEQTKPAHMKKELLPGWMPDTLKGKGNYGTYWTATEDNMKMVEKPKKVPAAPVPAVARPTGPHILHRGPNDQNQPPPPALQNYQPVPQIQPEWQKPDVAQPSPSPTVSKPVIVNSYQT